MPDASEHSPHQRHPFTESQRVECQRKTSSHDVMFADELVQVAAPTSLTGLTPCDNVRRVATNVQRAMRISRTLEEARESHDMR